MHVTEFHYGKCSFHQGPASADCPAQLALQYPQHGQISFRQVGHWKSTPRIRGAHPQRPLPSMRPPQYASTVSQGEIWSPRPCKIPPPLNRYCVNLLSSRCSLAVQSFWRLSHRVRIVSKGSSMPRGRRRDGDSGNACSSKSNRR